MGIEKEAMYKDQKIAMIIPCHNEEAAIASVIRDYKKVLPDAEIIVCDNNSTDKTTEVAQSEGATVIFEKLKGKGNAVRRLFSEVDADVYMMIDGDGTYDPKAAPELIDELVSNRLDMVVGCRVPTEGEDTYRPGHALGNKMLTTAAQLIFGRGFTDMLSGYRVFSKRFVKSFPVLSTGFEIETEITIHSLSLNLPCSEKQTAYFERVEGTESKLSTYRDGWRILMTIIRQFRDYKPMVFFTIIALLTALFSIGLSIPIIIEYLDTGLVSRLPTAVLCTGIMLMSFLSLTCGFILDSVARARLEFKKLAYLKERE